MNWNLEDALAYYRRQGAPGDQNMLIQLLREIQREQGNVPAWMVDRIAEVYGLKSGILHALIRRIPSLRLGEGHCLELCAGPNCGKHKALAAEAERLQKNGKISFTVRYVPCMRLCGKGPNLRWDGALYHGADPDLLRRLTGEEK
jgi:NADH:ubiquinone oxidoreductase subunit E